MGLRGLSVREMVSISEAWIAEGNPAHEAIVNIERLSALLPDVQGAHQAIFALVPRAENPRLAEIASLAAEADAVHDTLLRGIYGWLSGAALLESDGEALTRLRDTLVPEGTSAVIHDTYRGQAGYARLLRGRLTPEVRAQLEALPLRQGNLLERVTAWLDAGDRLGALEEERARYAKPEGASLGAQVVGARNRWIRTVNAFQAVAHLAELEPTTQRIVFGPLEDAQASADERDARRSVASTLEPSSRVEAAS